jgi:4-amino-4-deoxy-L-arabinose transferase-like glycosyltransferase
MRPEPTAGSARDARVRGALYFLPPLLAVGLVVLTLLKPRLNEPLFVHSTYYVLLASVLLYAGLWLAQPGEWALLGWLRDNLAGLLVTAVVSAVVVSAVAPAFRVLADETNLVGVSKNLFFRHTANFAVTGKWYFDNYWDLNLATDRRPALFPFLVSLLHLVRGYHAENAFHLNAILFVVFLFTCYRLAKKLGGELFGLAAAILVAANPNTLVAARSAGFDLLATLALVVAVNSFVDYTRSRSAWGFAMFSLNLCFLAHVRYEGWALLAASVGVVFSLRVVKISQLRSHAWLYAVLPLLLVPRYWQAIAKAKDAEQPLSASLFGLSHLWQNLSDYVGIAARPFEIGGPHAPTMMLLACGGVALLVVGLRRSLREKRLEPASVQVLLLVTTLVGMEAVICFSYFWGKPLHPASCRLYIWLDTAVAFAAAWLLTVVGRKLPTLVAPLRRNSGGPVALSACALLFVMHLPAAAEARFVNTMLVTRQAAETWRFFARLNEKRILILADRPGLYSVMDYGALDISSANADRTPLLELSRKLYRDIYMIQEVSLDTWQPLPGFDVWQDVEKQVVHEFQNTASTFIRISRITHPPRQ